MKKIVFVFVSLFLIFGCKNSTDKKNDKKIKSENLVEVKDGVFTEWYPGRKIIKFQGGQNELGNRDGKWTFYGEDGTELSYTQFSNGKKDGFSLVKYPNGNIHYTGEYQNDAMVGVWSTFDEKGNILSKKEYGERK